MRGGEGVGCGVPCMGAALQTQMLPNPTFPGFYLQEELVLQPQMPWGGRGGLYLLPLVEVAPPAWGMSVPWGWRGSEYGP